MMMKRRLSNALYGPNWNRSFFFFSLNAWGQLLCETSWTEPFFKKRKKKLTWHFRHPMNLTKLVFFSHPSQSLPPPNRVLKHNEYNPTVNTWTLILNSLIYKIQIEQTLNKKKKRRDYLVRGFNREGKKGKPKRKERKKNFHGDVVLSFIYAHSNGLSLVLLYIHIYI